MNSPQLNSQYYREKPVFGTGTPTPRRPRLEGNKGLLIFTLVIVAIAAASGFLYTVRGPSAVTSVEGAVPPAPAAAPTTIPAPAQ